MYFENIFGTYISKRTILGVSIVSRQTKQSKISYFNHSRILISRLQNFVRSIISLATRSNKIEKYIKSKTLCLLALISRVSK